MKSKLIEHDLDCFILYNPVNILYFTNFFTESIARFMIFPEESPILYVPELEYEEAKATAIGCTVKKITTDKTSLDLIRETAGEYKIKTCGIEENFIPIKDYNELTEAIKNVEFFSKQPIINQLRSTKTPEEIKKLKEAAKLADIGMEKAIQSIEVGKSELEVAASAEYEMRKSGSEPIPFDTIVASGIRSAFPHAKSSKYKIKKGDLVIIDLGAKYEGYASDTSRTIIVGKPSDKQKEIYTIVKKAQETALSRCHSGLKASELDAIARDIIREAGYGEYFNHSLGHGVGLDVHEDPTISFRNETELKTNNIITIEPGIYLPSFGGVRIEDTVVVKDDKCEALNKTEKIEY